MLTWKERDSTQVTESEEYQRHVLDTSKLPENLSTLISQLLEQLEKGNLDAALNSLQEIKSHVSDEALYALDVPHNFEFESKQNIAHKWFTGKSQPDFQALSSPSPAKDLDELSSREIYKLRKANDKLIEGKFTPFDSVKASTSGLLSFMARQNVRVPILLQEGSSEAASEILQLLLELGSFVLIDPVFDGQESVSTASPLLKYLVKLQNKVAEANSDEASQSILHVIASFPDKDNFWTEVLAKLLASGSL